MYGFFQLFGIHKPSYVYLNIKEITVSQITKIKRCRFTSIWIKYWCRNECIFFEELCLFTTMYLKLCERKQLTIYLIRKNIKYASLFSCSYQYFPKHSADLHRIFYIHSAIKYLNVFHTTLSSADFLLCATVCHGEGNILSFCLLVYPCTLIRIRLSIIFASDSPNGSY